MNSTTSCCSRLVYSLMYLNLGNLLESRGALVNNVDSKGLSLEILLQKAWEGVKERVFSSGASCHSVMPVTL